MKLLSSPKVREIIFNILSFVPDSVIVPLQYYYHTGHRLNQKSAKRFTEKIQLYKMKYRNDSMLPCTDKFEVRRYVKDKGLEDILIPLIGIYDNIQDVELDNLPNQFVAKTTDGSGGQQIILCHDRSKIDRTQFNKKLTSWMSYKRVKPIYREWAYQNTFKRRIIIEKLIVNTHDSYGDKEFTPPNDYKFLCYDGKMRFMWIDRGRYGEHCRGFWNEDFDFLPNVESDHPTFNVPPVLPDNILEMKRIAERLSENFPFVRVDLYNSNGKIYFGEMTFYPWSGYVKFTPDSFDFELGKYLKI